MATIMTIRPPDTLRQALKQAANLRGLTLNALVLQILWDWVRENNTLSEAGAGRG